MFLLEYIHVLVAILLCAFLVFRLRYRPPPLPPSYWTGHGINVGNLKSRVRMVQAGFRSSQSPRHSDNFSRKNLVAVARRTVRRLPFFHSMEAESSQTATE